MESSLLAQWRFAGADKGSVNRSMRTQHPGRTEGKSWELRGNAVGMRTGFVSREELTLIPRQIRLEWNGIERERLWMPSLFQCALLCPLNIKSKPQKKKETKFNTIIQFNPIHSDETAILSNLIQKAIQDISIQFRFQFNPIPVQIIRFHSNPFQFFFGNTTQSIPIQSNKTQQK